MFANTERVSQSHHRSEPNSFRQQVLCVRYAKRVSCHGCKQTISGPFTKVLGESYHPSCLTCDLCGRHLKSAFKVDYWKTKYCVEHELDFPSCMFCGRLVSSNRQDSKKVDRERCLRCLSNPVVTMAAARYFFKKVNQWINCLGLTYDNLPLKVELVQASSFPHSKYKNPSTLGQTLWSYYADRNGNLANGKIEGISVLMGLPPILFQGVTVHELGHVWLHLNGVNELRLWEEEGFCEWLSYQFYHWENASESIFYARSIECSPDPVYGEGFRRVAKIIDQFGREEILRYLRIEKRLPSNLVNLG